MNEKIHICERDFIRLIKLTKYHPAPKLINELERAEVIKSMLVYPDLVTIDSTVIYTVDQKIHQSTLVSSKVPEEQNLCISVLDELGTALIGMSENQMIKWDHGDGEWNIRILNVVYQPETMGEPFICL